MGAKFFKKNIIDDSVYDKLCHKHFLGVPRYISIAKAIGHSRTYLSERNAYSSTGFLSICKLFFGYLRNMEPHYRKHKREGSVSFFYYGFYNYRFDHYKIVDEFSSSFKDIMDSYCYFGRNVKFRLLNFFTKAPFFFIWLIQMLFSGYTIKTTYIIIDYLNSFLDFKKVLKSINIHKYSFLVTYYDVSFDQNIITQYFKYMGKTTVTMQHGIMKPNYYSNLALTLDIPFKYSLSDYFIVWSKMNKEFALESRHLIGNVVALGIPRYINHTIDSEHIINKNRKVFGVVLSGFEGENIEMLKMANKYAREKGFRYIVRHSPYTKKGIYNKLIDFNLCEEIDSTVNIDEYLRMVSFSITGSTSLFIDFIYLNHRTFLYSGYVDFVYKEIVGITFDDYDEFLSNLSSDKFLLNREYISGPSNIKKSYNDFFMKLVK